jgi:SAM-dependent MidA family methyltransferase
LFGELLALQFCCWLEELNGRVSLVESGAHRGSLARDILRWLRDHNPAVFKRTEYLIVEPSARRQQWQRDTLLEFGTNVRWAPSLDDLAQNCLNNPARQPIRGLIFSNELLDAMPVRRLGWDAHRSAWFEWGVTFSSDQFCWAKLDLRTIPDALSEREWPEAITTRLPDEFTIELNTAASNWWAKAASLLGAGKLITLDYGTEQSAWLMPERTNGTLRAYRDHRLAPEILADPGEQDITAHVDFSALQRAGTEAGLITEQLVTQEKFLTHIAVPALNGKTQFGEWTRERVRQFQTLTHPHHLGHSFKVLVQSR